MRFGISRLPARFFGLAASMALAVFAVPVDSAWALVSVSASQAPVTVRPGTAEVVIYEFTVNNHNLLLGNVRVLGVRLTNTTQGPGTVAQKDNEFAKVRLLRDAGNSGFDRSDPELGQGTASSGVFEFSGFSVTIAPGSSARFLVVSDVSLLARDGDALDLAIVSSSDITFGTSESFQGTTFPIAPAGSFPVDGMVAAQIGVSTKSLGSVIAGTRDNLALDVVLPANGYEEDKLETIEVINTGTALAGSDLTGMSLWADEDRNGAFDPDRDRRIGSLSYVGGARWVRSGVGEAVPAAGLRLMVTVDVGDLAIEGRSIRLSLPTQPDAGVGMSSNNDGPLDLAVDAPERTVSTANRLTLSATPLSPVIVRPGARDVKLLHFSITNSYGTPQALDRLSVENAGIGGTPAQRDAAVQSLVLRMDGNGDGALGDSLTDPPLAGGFFTGGHASFTGFTAPLIAGATRHFFVTAQVSLTAAADGDTLSTRVASPLDVGLGDTTRVVASWPLDSRARAAVDGMVAAQLTALAVPAVSLAPGDSAVLAMDVIVPRNGWANDVIQSLEIVNLGTADDTDLDQVHWWRDGGDGAFAPGSGDDIDLGVASWTGGSWRIASLAQPLGVTGARLFVAVSVAASPTDSVTVRFAIPTMGVTVVSGNDGPLDAVVPSPTNLTVSASPLLASLEIQPAASVPGQQVTVSMVVRNAGPDSLVAITPSGLAQSGPGSLTPESGPTPASVDLAPGERDTLIWTFRAATPGDVFLTGSAQGTERPSGMPRRSLDAVTDPHHIFDQVTHLDGDFEATLPAMVNRGQTGIVAFDLSLANSNVMASPVRFLGLRIGLADELGAGIVPDSLLARIAVHRGTTEHLSRTALETSGSQVDLTLATPVLIGAGETVTLTVSLDLESATSVSSFQVAIADSSWMMAEDATSGALVTVQLPTGYPAVTGLARVFERPSEVQVSAITQAEIHVGPGQLDVPMLSFRLLSPGAAGITSDVRIGGLALDASDTLGTGLPLLADVVSHVLVRTGFQTVASRAVLAVDGPKLTLLLSPGINVPVNTLVDVQVSGDIATAAIARSFRLRLTDSTLFDARDAITRDPVDVWFTSDPLPGRTVRVEMPADQVAARGTPAFPVGVRAGDAGVPAMTLVLRHPGDPGDAPLRVDSVIVLSRDHARRPLAPALFLDALRVRWNGVDAGGNGDPPTSGEATGIDLGGRMLAVGDSATIELSADISAAAPEGFLELYVYGEGLSVYDANLGTRATVVPEGGPLPFTSGLTRVQAPARTLIASLANEMPAVLAGDGREIQVATLGFENPAAPGAGSIRIRSLVLRGADHEFTDQALGATVAEVLLRANGAIWAQVALTPDSVHAKLVGGSELEIDADSSLALEVSIVPRAGLEDGTVRVGLDAAGVGVVQPSGGVLQIQVLPVSGKTFPLWTEAGGFGPLELSASYSNFPNPFAAGREETSFAYYLNGDCRVWLRLFTLAGEPVRTLADGVARTAGMQQLDRWDGMNGVGQTVRNGVYIAELRVQYEAGASARALRKVAVRR
jgi:hypothetical protein